MVSELAQSFLLGWSVLVIEMTKASFILLAIENTCRFQLLREIRDDYSVLHSLQLFTLDPLMCGREIYSWFPHSFASAYRWYLGTCLCGQPLMCNLMQFSEEKLTIICHQDAIDQLSYSFPLLPSRR